MNKVWFIASKVPHQEFGASGGDISNYLELKRLSENYDISIFSIFSFRQINNLREIILKKKKLSSWNNLPKFFAILNKFLILPIKIVFNYSSYPDTVLLTRGGITYGRLIRYLFGNRCKIYIIVRAYEDLNFSNNTNILPKKSLWRMLDYKFSFFFVKLGFKVSNKIIVNSNFMKSKIINLLDNSINQIKVVYPKTYMKKKIPYFKNIKSIGFINRGEHKGTTFINELATQLNQYNFYIFGDRLETNLTNVIQFGYQTNREFIYDKIQLILVPSIWPEPYGRVASEAIISGVPCLVHNIGGLAEAVNSDIFKLDNLDPYLWVEKINWINKNITKVITELKKSQLTLLEREKTNLGWI